MARINYRLEVQREEKREKVWTNSVRSAGEIRGISLDNPAAYELVEGAP